jgi:hypothetical protein
MFGIGLCDYRDSNEGKGFGTNINVSSNIESGGNLRLSSNNNMGILAGDYRDSNKALNNKGGAGEGGSVGGRRNMFRNGLCDYRDSNKGKGFGNNNITNNYNTSNYQVEKSPIINGNNQIINYHGQCEKKGKEDSIFSNIITIELKKRKEEKKKKKCMKVI